MLQDPIELQKSLGAAAPQGAAAVPEPSVNVVSDPSSDLLVSHLNKHFSKWLARKEAEEIAINRPGEVEVWAGGQWQRFEDADMTREVLETLGRLVANHVRKPFNASNVTLSTALPDGTRIEMTGPPATVNNAIYVNLRKHTVVPFKLADFVNQGYFANTKHEFVVMPEAERERMKEMLNPEQIHLWELAQAGRWVEFLELAVKDYANILISGATGTGKTSFLRGLIELIPTDERLLTVEDTHEMPLPNHRNSQHLLYRRDGADDMAGASAKEMLQAGMRKTPKRVLLAELRGDETYYFVQNVLNSGHPGGMSTTHANHPKAAFLRLALLIKASPEGAGMGVDETLLLLRQMIDVVVQLVFKSGQKRHCSAIYYDPMYAMSLSM